MASTQQQIELVAYGADAMWFILTTVLIVSLQAGFALREYGWVQKKNSTDILYKYLFNGFITVIAWWVLGYGFAYGNTKGGFIGVSKFGLDSGEFDFKLNKAPEYQSFFAEWALAAVAVTIVGGALGERVKLPALVAVAFFVAIWIYPIIVHWTWGLGWLSYRGATVTKYLFYGKDSNNYIDTAGSGIVHAVGGVAALVGAIALGARKVTVVSIIFASLYLSNVPHFFIASIRVVLTPTPPLRRTVYPSLWSALSSSGSATTDSTSSPLSLCSAFPVLSLPRSPL
jgi:Amt family ammonium transporter